MQKTVVEIKHFHLFCGAGGGAKGFNNGKAEVGNLQAKFRCIGGVDVDPAGIADFKSLSGVPGTVLDMFDRSQYKDFHGEEPPADWKEATPADIQKAAGNERPHIVFLSAPCKGFSGLLAEGKSKTAKYQALNRLTVRGVFLMLEAFGDDPPELILFENVPRIATRGRQLLDSINAMLEAYGYAVSETTHDCGEIGNLAQSRKRFLLVARHKEKIMPFLYEPEKRPLRGVGEVIGKLPIPGSGYENPMHRLPRLTFENWVRLGLIEAGKDWRSLNRLKVVDGILSDYVLVPEYQNGYFGVKEWSQPIGTIAGSSRPGNGAYSVADPRLPGIRHNNVFKIMRYDQPSNSVTSGGGPTAGGLSVADPRTNKNFSGYGVKKWQEHSNTVSGESLPSNGSFAVADPRFNNWHPKASSTKLKITGWESKTGTITGSSQIASGAQSVADPRPFKSNRKNFQSGGHYGVIAWDEFAKTISGSQKHDNGRSSVADPRGLPAPSERLVARIIAEDGTWHRPFTTLELAALQGLIDPEEHLILDGLSDSKWRERIGNAVPPAAAEAIAGEMGKTLLAAWSGQTMSLGNTPIWVRNISIALSV